MLSLWYISCWIVDNSEYSSTIRFDGGDVSEVHCRNEVILLPVKYIVTGCGCSVQCCLIC
jgi:hypothetical protein